MEKQYIYDEFGHMSKFGEKTLSPLIKQLTKLIDDTNNKAETRVIGAMLQNIIGQIIFNKLYLNKNN